MTMHTAWRSRIMHAVGQAYIYGIYSGRMCKDTKASVLFTHHKAASQHCFALACQGPLPGRWLACDRLLLTARRAGLPFA